MALAGLYSDMQMVPKQLRIRLLKSHINVLSRR